MGNLTALLGKIQPAIAAAGCKNAKDERCVAQVAEANVRESLEQIHRNSSLIASAVAAGTVDLVGAMYDVASGKVTFLQH